MLRSLKIRQSNFELLRVLCMFNILLYHLLFHGSKGLCLQPVAENVSYIIEAFIGFHVNAFLLISGYFGIKVNLRSAVNFLLPCLFYSIIIFIIFDYASIEGNDVIRKFIKRLMFICRDSPWWFVEKYFYLFLTAPIFNICINKSEKKELIIILFLLLYVNILLGGVFKSDFNRNGFTYNHFVFMYMIGGIIKRFNFSISNKWGGVIYLFASLILCFPIIQFRIHGYVNPFIIIQSISVFLLFKNLDLSSRIVNKIASSTFAVYLLHDEDVYSRPFLTHSVNSLYTYFSNDLFFIASLIILCILLFATIIAIDMIIKIIFLNKVSNCLNKTQKYLAKWVHL